jgi:hypothetical protein
VQDYNHLPRGIRVLNLIWHGTKLWRHRSTTFYQDFLHPHRGKQHVVELFDTFVNVPVPTIEVPRRCAVLELLGPSLSEIRTERASQRLETGVVKEATRQVLLALDFLHTQCGILYLGESHIIVSGPIPAYGSSRPRHRDCLAQVRDGTRGIRLLPLYAPLHFHPAHLLILARRQGFRCIGSVVDSRQTDGIRLRYVPSIPLDRRALTLYCPQRSSSTMDRYLMMVGLAIGAQ